MGSFMSIGSFSLLSWGKGNDKWTRTPSGFKIDPNFEWSKYSATWEVIPGRERHLFETTGQLNKVISRHASMFANGRFVHKKKDGTKEGKIIEDSPLVELLENPNPLQSGEEWLTECAINYWVFGNNVMLPIKPIGSSDPYVINNLPWDQIKITTTGKRWNQNDISGIIKEYRIRYSDSQDDIYKPNEVIHFRRTGGKSAIIGESILNACHMEVSNIRGAMGYRNVNITKKGALGIWANKTSDSIGGGVPLREEDRLAVERQNTEETYGIHEGQSTVRIVNGDVNFVPTSFAIKENMLFEEISEDTKLIIDLVQLNDNIFSKEKAKIQANLLEGLRMGYQDGIFPFAGRFCSTLKRGLNLPADEWLELDYSHLPCFKEDEKEKSEIDKNKATTYKTYIDSGVLPEEARELVGLKPL